RHASAAHRRLSSLVSSSCYGHPRHLPPSPTRRSSDLTAPPAATPCPGPRTAPSWWTRRPGGRGSSGRPSTARSRRSGCRPSASRSEEHTSELQSLTNLVCRLLLEKKKKNIHLYPTVPH